MKNKPREILADAAKERVLILDGAMGSLIQAQKLLEKDFRGEPFADHPAALLGCNDALCVASPRTISAIHEAYLDAGADIIETCSFNSTAVSLADYGLADKAYEISRAAAALARAAAAARSTAEKPRFVAGSIGPTAKSAGISSDAADPAKRSVEWDELEAAYYDNARGLLDGGADIFLVETVFDVLNAKAALFAIGRLLEERGLEDFPVMISATVYDSGGRLLSGQTVEAFAVSVLHADPLAIGLNCSFGAEKLMEPARSLSAFPCLVSVHPNAGLPNQAGFYDESPDSMADKIEEYLKEGLVNIVGGCCGTTPAHIAAIAERVKKYRPRLVPAKTGKTLLSGLETLEVGGGGLTLIGERCNVAGSRAFRRYIKEENYDEAVEIAARMSEAGAAVIDICMDDPLIDAPKAMKSFINLAVCFRAIAQVPLMVDSSRFETIETALKNVQGKGLVNSISLKEGETVFLRRARLIRRYGAAAVVMLFDERGQAVSYERKIEVAGRSYKLLTGAGFPPEDIVFDPNVLAVATGMSEYDRSAIDFIRACAWIRENCPGARSSGGITNLSFSFRGNDAIRAVLHAVFLKHAAEAGLDMAIVNPAALVPYDDIEEEPRKAAEDLVLRGESAAADRLISWADGLKTENRRTEIQNDAGILKKDTAVLKKKSLNHEDSIVEAMLNGVESSVEADILALLPVYALPLDIVEKVLMRGMREIGERFAAGRLFLPQVLRGARVMKKAVSVLRPYIEKTSSGGRQSQKIVLATVKGDVHDIGKNIVATVLACNGYQIVDLGTMVPAERIIEAALREEAAVVGLSALISPSLDEMIHTAQEMERRGMKIPLLVGGAATSLAHTALRMAPVYSGPLVYVADAGQSSRTVSALLGGGKPRFLEELAASYREAAARHEAAAARLKIVPLEEARGNRVPRGGFLPPAPKTKGIIDLNGFSLKEVAPYIDWEGFLRSWELARGAFSKVPGEGQKHSLEEARKKLLDDAGALLESALAENTLPLRGAAAVFPAKSRGEDVVLFDESEKNEVARFSFLRGQEKKIAGACNPSLSDFIGSEGGDYLGLFVLSAGTGFERAAAVYRGQGDSYRELLLASLANSLTEAFSERVHELVAGEYWGFAAGKNESRGIRPAFGYPSCPDHHDKEIVFRLLDAEKRCGLTLTETAMINPAASVCGMYIAHPGAYYFSAMNLGEDQLEDWASRKGISLEAARARLGKI